MASLATIAGAGLILGITLILTNGVRKCFFHPLRAFPGPLVNRVSELPATIALVMGQQHVYFRRLHERYGSVVRVAPNELSFMGADAWEDIYGVRGHGGLEKSPVFIGAVSPTDGQMGIGMAPKATHNRQRRALGGLMSNSAIREQQSLLQKHASKLVTAVGRLAKDHQAVNLSSWYSYTTFDIMGDLCFAEPFGCLEQHAATEWSTSIIRAFEAATWDQAVRRLAGVDTWLQRLMVKLCIPSAAARWRSIHFSNSRDQVLRRLAEGDRNHKDFISHLLQNQGSKRSLTETEIILNIVLLVSAGAETTANLLTAWTWFICTDSDAYSRVTTEILSHFPSDQHFTWEAMQQLPFLDATVNETLRLYPPGVINQQRVVPPDGAIVDGRFVPGGTTVSVAQWAATHSSQNFSLPEKFIPDRWLDGLTGDKLHASQPFGLGPRGCLGRNLAFFEAKLIIVNMVWNFELSLEDRGPFGQKNGLWATDEFGDRPFMKAYQAWLKPDLWIRLKRRNRE